MMQSVVYCTDCGIKANPTRVSCEVCGRKITAPPRSNPVYSKLEKLLPNAAIFDLDMTIFDNSQRFKDARRAGLVDKQGKAVRKGMMSMGQAWRKRDKFLYSRKQLSKDTIIPGAKELITSLINDGYTIIYLTARPKTHYGETIYQLESNGFPLFRDQQNDTLLVMKDNLRVKPEKYKAEEIRRLSGSFKIEMVFDDDEKVLEEASKFSIPGIYQSVEDHVRVNSRHEEEGAAPPITVVEDEDDGVIEKVETMKVGIPHHSRKQMDTEEWQEMLAEQGFTNPFPKPKKAKKSGRKEPAKKYVERLMDSSKMKKEFPDRSQRYAVAMSVAEKHYGKTNPRKGYNHNFYSVKDEKLMDMLTNITGFANSGTGSPYKIKISGTKIGWDFGKEGKTITENVVDFKETKSPLKRFNYVHTNALTSEGYNPLFLSDIGSISRVGQSVVIDKIEYIESGWRTFWKHESYLSADMYKEEQKLWEEGDANAEVSLSDVGWQIQQVCKDSKGLYLWDGKERVRFDKMSTTKKNHLTIAIGQYSPRSKIQLFAITKNVTPTKSVLSSLLGNPRANPASKKKVDKAKKLYKHMNQKEPDKIETTKIDVGDVWYQVGEGGCWQIGYMSGKETKQEDQKYTHTFNEETKDGNYPKLYATMPEKGKPLLIIKGGTWKIKCDEEGVAWIYD